MTDFTALFTQTLNDTIAKAVAEAVAKATVTHAGPATSDLCPDEAPTHITIELAAWSEVWTRIRALEAKVEELDQVDPDTAIENFIDNYDFTRIIEDRDYSEVVKNCIDKIDLFDGPDFTAAVASVIDNHDFTDIVDDVVKFESMLDSDDFERAARNAVSSALLR